jgi:glutamate racemase
MTTVFLDWGIGGLSVYRAVKARVPHAYFWYFSDSGSTPYGKLSVEEMRARLVKIANYLRDHGVAEVVVACNAASSVLIGDFEILAGVKFWSLIPYGKRALVRCTATRIGVIGGHRTIESEVYAHVRPGIVSASAQPLSALIESGDCESGEVESVIAPILKRLGNIEALLLACTHYPAARRVFLQMRPGLTLLDPAEWVADDFENRADARAVPKTTSESQPLADRFTTTGDVEGMRSAAAKAFTLSLVSIESLPVQLNVGITR